MYTELIKIGVSESFANGALHLGAKYQRRKLQYMSNEIYCIFIYCIFCNIVLTNTHIQQSQHLVESKCHNTTSTLPSKAKALSDLTIVFSSRDRATIGGSCSVACPRRRKS